MRKIAPWLLWIWIMVVIWAAFFYAPLAEGFVGQSSRILFFHVPMAWVSFVAFLAAGAWSIRFLAGGRRVAHDHAASAAVELGLLFCVLATVTGALWARVMWGAFWNWDPRQTSIVLAMIFYAAYLALRSAVEEPETRRRLAAAYAVLGLVVAPFLFFVLPRLTFSLHPDTVVNLRGRIEMESRMRQVLAASSLAFTVLFFWIHRIQVRLKARAERAPLGRTRP
ncbi:MAG TPA: cytochrome c biogenesis protein CcsA [Thermoanaerobaculia bacterium]|jgi:heme exporter protein C|nr:cytochrome c biogenesis protein CcsA [Thermoanaerobaculia bacterium]MBP7812210.1 cytochrome c biogenesis protein CcsA [Thermoanaerobaculia bacterium]MBP8845793.1 cytochrome c biogenesis protein CcsA [Thermoanaerobaculia bacterium]HNU82414.1 cytochrome c biogenesis protein CcsA [Thermoanaerobaculia bacterium]HPA94833.1 cytochrome c biogenesis protein CcsA [Thermoanaerobaculia bacterium]